MSEENKPDEATEIRFKYLKSNFFRVVHADGAWGGISPRGNIHISFYSERWAIPDTSRVYVDEEKIRQDEQSHGAIRELEVDVVVDLDTARRLSAWLNHKIGALEALIENAQEKIVNADEKTTNSK